MHNFDQIITLAKEIEAGEPIDWSDLPLEQDTVYRLLGSSVMERVEGIESHSSREAILMATAINLVVANFILQLRLRDFDK